MTGIFKSTANVSQDTALYRISKENNHLDDLGVDRRIILKLILKK